MRPEHDRLGLVQWFRHGESELVEACIEDIRRLGITHLRTHLSWADYYRDDGQQWCAWLLATLARHVDVLPCLHYTPPSLAESGRTSGPPRDLRSFADFIDHIITR